MSKTISGLPLAETLTGNELLPVVQDGNTVQSTVQQMADLVGNTTTWGDIQGTLSNQTDLQNALNLKVPYTGATGNVNLGEYGISAGYFQADLTPTNALQVGRMQWNDQDGTMDLRLKGNNVTLQIGQEQVIRVVNKTGATLTETDYQCVKISGAQGQRPKVDLAQANNDANSADTIGLVTETISNNQEGFVTTSGMVRNINTTGSLQGETWADGDVLYLSGTTAGRLTNIKPQAPIHTVIVGFVIYAHNNQGKIFVKVDNGYELNELHNVRINGVTDGQVLAYDSTLSVWENINQSAITSGNSDKVDGYHVQVDGTGTDPNTIYFKTTGGVDPSAAIWGDITGSIVDQTDLYNALVNGTYATGNWNINAASVDGYSVQVDGTGTDPNTIYFKTTGGTTSVAWGNISGTLSAQTDLQTALDGKYSTSNPSGYITASALTPYAPINNPTFTGTVSGITKAMVGLGNVDNTADAVKSVSYATSSGNADTVDGYNVQVDGTGTNPNTIYFKTTGGSISVEWDDVSNTPTTIAGYGITDAVTTSGDQTVGGTKTFSSTITGSITGNAGTVTNGVYTSGDQTIGGNKTFSSTIIGSVSGNAGTVTNGVYTSGNQTIGGTKTFSSTISGSIDGNSNTVDGYHVQVDGTGTDPNTIYFKTTGGSIGVDWDDISNTPTTVAGYGITDAVTTSGNQTIGGTKTFSSTITGSITGNAGTVTDGVYLSGTQTITGNKTFTGSVTMGQSGGGEGGEIFWLDPVQGTVVTDVPASGAFRVFQASGTAKGAYIDLANCAGGVGSLLLHSTNYNSYAPTLTGTGASGSWGISVTGNAGTVTNGVYTTGNQTIGGTKTFSSTISGSVSGNAGTATTLQATPTINNVTFAGNANITVPRVRALDDRILAPADGSANYVTAYFTSWANDNTSPYADALLFRTWGDGSGGNDNLVTFRKNAFGMRIWQQTSGSATAFSSFKDVAWTDGTNATGTWTISTSGNAGTVTNGVYTTGDQTIAGIKTFSSSVDAPSFRDSANTSYYLDPANTGTSMVVAGNVGIGTTSPTFRLVSANSSFDGGWLYSTGVVSILGLGGYFDASAGAFSLRYDRSTGNITFNGGSRDTPTERMRIDGSGNVGIGVVSPTVKLDVAGSILASGNVTAYSDIRVKDNIENITDAVDKLSQIRGVTYTRTDLDDKERKYAGVIAQEIEQVLPEAVFDNGKVKGVDYNATIALLIEAVKEQQGQINELKLTIEQLKGN